MLCSFGAGTVKICCLLKWAGNMLSPVVSDCDGESAFSVFRIFEIVVVVVLTVVAGTVVFAVVVVVISSSPNRKRDCGTLTTVCSLMSGTDAKSGHPGRQVSQKHSYPQFSMFRHFIKSPQTPGNDSHVPSGEHFFVGGGFAETWRRTIGLESEVAHRNSKPRKAARNTSRPFPVIVI